jgi:hypothetical protein
MPLIAILIFPSLSPGFDLRKIPEESELADALATMQQSKDPDELTQASTTLISSGQELAMCYLFHFLTDKDFLYRLDSRDDYRYKKYRNLRITRVLLAVADIPNGWAESLLIRLTFEGGYDGSGWREDAVIHAMGYLKTVPTELLDYLDKKDFDRSNIHQVMETLARLKTPETCAQMERRYLSSDNPLACKRGWLSCDPISVRNEPCVVALYKRLLFSKDIDPGLLDRLAETLFDFRYEWHGTAPISSDSFPPKWKCCSTEVLEDLLKIADGCERLKLSKTAWESVQRGRLQIQDTLRRRARATADRVSQLLADLDHDDFRTRQKANKELESLGDAVEGDLRKLLDMSLSLDARKRVQGLLKSIEKTSEPIIPGH